VNNNQYIEKIFYADDRPKPLFTLNNPILVCKAERIVDANLPSSRSFTVSLEMQSSAATILFVFRFPPRAA
jgi:hypothetical protein